MNDHLKKELMEECLDSLQCCLLDYKWKCWCGDW